MINKNELRIGNWVLFNNPEPKEIQILDGEMIDNWSANPIPLTEEWLKRFGVNEIKGQDVYRVNFVEMYDSGKKFQYMDHYYFDGDGNVDKTFVEIKYVHQLQNLYLALTGQELTIKSEAHTS